MFININHGYRAIKSIHGWNNVVVNANDKIVATYCMSFEESKIEADRLNKKFESKEMEKL